MVSTRPAEVSKAGVDLAGIPAAIRRQELRFELKWQVMAHAVTQVTEQGQGLTD